MGMDKRLQCLVGLTWWNLLQCTWGELEWPASYKPAAGIFQDNLIESTANLRKVFQQIFARCGKSWWSGEVWCMHFDTAQQQKRSTLHLTPCLLAMFTAHCTQHNTTPCLLCSQWKSQLAHSTLYSVQCTLYTTHTASNTLAAHCVYTLYTNLVHMLYTAHDTLRRANCTQHTHLWFDFALCTKHCTEHPAKCHTAKKDVYSPASGCGFATLLMTPLEKRLCGNSCDQS